MEIAYFTTKHVVWYQLVPLYNYSITLAFLYVGRMPFRLNSQPLESPLDFFSGYPIVLAYYLMNSLANFFAYSWILDDPNNPNNVLWRGLQELYGYSWVRVIGIIEGALSAMTGKQPKWNAFGMAGGINLIYELPVAIAFTGMALSMCLVAGNYYVETSFGAGLKFLPGPATMSVSVLVSCLLACSWILFLMWPVTSCIFADFLRLPYYRLGAVTSTLLAATVQVGICMLFFSTELAGR